MSTVVTQLKNAAVAAASAIKAAEPKPAATAKPATAPAKKAPPKAAKAPEPTERRGFSNEAVITVRSTDHGLRGLRAEALDAIKNGMTVESFKRALAKKEMAGSNRLSTYTGWALKTAIAAKMITVK